MDLRDKLAAATIREIAEVWNRTRNLYDMAVHNELDAIVFSHGESIPYKADDVLFRGAEEDAESWIDDQCATAVYRLFTDAESTQAQRNAANMEDGSNTYNR